MASLLRSVSSFRVQLVEGLKVVVLQEVVLKLGGGRPTPGSHQTQG